MPVKSDRTLGWTTKTAAVSVLLAMDEHRKAAGLRLVRIRESRRMTQEDLAHAAGVSVKTISRFENGHHDGRRGTIKKIAKALGIEEQDVTGPPPAPLGLGFSSAEEQLERRVEEMEERLAALIETQNGLLSRQSDVLDRLERSQAEIERLLSTQLDAARQMEEAAAMMRAVDPLPPAPPVEPTQTPRQAS
jgi:transcriptional regulator with XRE-family HTH domain